MTKLKFGDKVWHDEFKLGIILYKDETCDDEYMIYFERDDYHTTMKDCELTKVSDWIPCIERMPEYDSEVIVTDGNYVWRDKCYDFGDGLCFYDDNDSSATHWMPLPDMPEVKE